MDELLAEYIENHIDAEPEHLKRLYRDANLELLYPRMMSGHQQGRLLKMLTSMIKPRRVLELGTFAGYSTLCIAEGLPEGSKIDTIEIDDELEAFISRHFSASGYADRICLHVGDAMEIVPRLAAMQGQWDMMFIDADKRRYPEYYMMLKPLLKSGGWMLADNTLWNADVAKASGNRPSNHKNDQLNGIMKFNEMVADDTTIEKVIVPIRDGITIIHKK